MKKTIKIIDLFSKIAKGEQVPERIIYNNTIYDFCVSCQSYETLDTDECREHDLYHDLDNLNDEVEIMEEIEKPKRIKEVELRNKKGETIIGANMWNFYYKINELIKVVNYLLDKDND